MTRRPLLDAPAFDGMDLGPMLEEVLGEVPKDAELEKLRGDASTRSYYRIHLERGPHKSLIVMRLPGDALKSDEGQGAARPHELPFINVHRLLKERGIRVPAVFADHTHRGALLLEDLGDETFGARLDSRPRAEWESLYGQAISVLARMHESCREKSPGCLAYERSFDQKLLRWELEHFREWGLDALDIQLTQSERTLLDQSFDELVRQILSLPRGFVHRDYQSRNLMWVRDEIVVIDFQDALEGPAVYDLVALLCDSYVSLDEATQRALMARYAGARGLDAREVERAFWLVAAQRKLKDAGRFVFIDQVRGNPDFLRWFGRSLSYAGRALSKLPEMAELFALLSRKLEGFPDHVAQPAAQTGRHLGRGL